MSKRAHKHLTCTSIKMLQHGFTLAELMVVVAIVSILAGIAAPSFKNMIETSRVDGATNALTTALELTRDTARLMNGNVSIAKLSGTNCSADSNWSCGWQVFQDTNGNGALNTGEIVLQDFALNGTEVTVTRSTNAPFMTGNRWGQLSGTATTGFVLIPHGTTAASLAGVTVCMNSGGRIRTLKSKDLTTCP
jgi:type IV fimbrial biogenesis protein FimT